MQPSGSLHEETASVQRQFSGVDPCSYVKVHRGGKGWQGEDLQEGRTMNRLWSWVLKAALTFQQASVLPERGTPSWPRPSKHTAESSVPTRKQGVRLSLSNLELRGTIGGSCLDIAIVCFRGQARSSIPATPSHPGTEQMLRMGNEWLASSLRRSTRF